MAQGPPCSSLPAPATEALTPRTPPGSVRARAQTEPSYRHLEGASRLRLCDIAEHRVVRYGIRHLREELAPEGSELPALPRRPNGTSRLLQRSFFERLLSEQIELQSSLPSDVAAAQPDLKLLDLEHLLTIRDGCSDFNTDSRSYEVHQAFLEQLERRLQELLAERHLAPQEVMAVSKLKLPIGRMTVLAKGVAALLTGQAPGAEGFAAAEGPGAVPSLWLLPLSADAFPDHSALLICVGQEQKLPVPATGGYMSATPSTAPSSSESSPKTRTRKDDDRPTQLPSPTALARQADAKPPGGPKLALLGRPPSVADLEVVLDSMGDVGSAGVVSDRSSGSGKTRRVCWEVAVLRGDLCSPERILAELSTAVRGAAISAAGIGGSASLNSPLGKELAETLRRRVTAPEIRKIVI